MYQALYRKWRPRSFDDVVGQEHITQTLKRQVESNRLSHAYLFVGTRGTGKTTCAKILSKAVNCEHPVNGNPCNACPTCLGIDSGRILDVEELDAASNNGVDNVRMLREEAVFSPAAAKKRVYIVDEVHMLSTAAFNALLKILEEPPEHLIFILATTELHKVPATILSRCQRFSFRRLEREQIANHLLKVASQESMNLTPDGAALLARLADGAMRDALSLLDQCSSAQVIDPSVILELVGLSGAQKTLELLDAIVQKNSAQALMLLDELHAAGKDMASLIDELTSLVRDILITKVAGKQAERLYSGMFDSQSLQTRAGSLSTARLMSVLQTLEDATRDMGKSSNRRLAAELCVIRLCDEALSSDRAAVLSRLDALESALQSGVVPTRASAPAPVMKPAEEPTPAPVSRVSEPAVPADAPPWDEPPFDSSSWAQEDPAPQPEPGPAVTPAAETAPNAPAAQIPAVSADAGWPEILQQCRATMDLSNYMVLSDETRCTAQLDGNNLVVIARSPFDVMLLEQAPIPNQLRQAAKAALGHEILVRVTDEASYSSGNTQAGPSSKLDALSKMGVVFE